MKIHYAITDKGTKLFSFTRHDYRKDELGNFIDGGFDYTRTNCKIEHDEISNLIEDIREQFTWTSVLDENENKRDTPVTRYLKDLDNSHIINVIRYLTKYKKKHPSTANIDLFIEIFRCELKYRLYDSDIFQQ